MEGVSALSDKDFILLVAIFAGAGSLLAFLFPNGAGLPVRVWPFSTREQSVRFTAWAMLVVAVLAFFIWLFKR